MSFPDFPKGVFIQTNNVCNSRCIICPYRKTYANQEKKQMRAELLSKILTDLTPEYSGQIGFYLQYEPLTDQRIVSLLILARKMCPRAEIAISTNAQLLTQQKADEIIQSCALDVCCFNVNGGTRESYEKNMVGCSWEKMKSNIRYFKDRFKKLCYINFVRHEGNRDEARFLRRIFPDIDVHDEYWASSRIDQIDIKKRKEDITRFSRCIEIENNIPILLDGTVILCCNCWNKEVEIGNANDENILTLWRSKLRNKDYDICKTCQSIN